VVYDKEGRNGNVIKANTFWQNKTDVENCDLPGESLQFDPQFSAFDQDDFSLRGGDAKAQLHGLTHPELFKRLWGKYQSAIQ